MKKKWLLGILIVILVVAVVLSACSANLTLTVVTEDGRATDYAIRKGDKVTSVVEGDYQFFTDAAHTEPFDPSTRIKEDLTLYAVATNKCVVSFVTGGGTSISPVTVAKGDTLPSYVQTNRDHYAFEGWYTNAALTDKFDTTTPITESMTLYAKWTRTEYVVTLNSLSSVQQVTVPVGGSLKLVGLIEKFTYNTKRYHFISWKDESGVEHDASETIPVSRDMTLTAVFDEETFNFVWDSAQNYYVVEDLYDTDVEVLTIPSTFDDGEIEGAVGAIKYLGNSFRLTHVTVPDSVVYIYQGAFRDLAGIQSINAPFIGEHKFTALPTGSDFIGKEGMFGYWFRDDETGAERAGFTAVPSQYKEFYVDDQQIGPHETYYYIPNSLTTVTIRGGVIPEEAFYNQTTIHKVVFGVDVTAIGKNAFANSSKLEDLLSEYKYRFTEVEFLPDSNFTTFGEQAFLANYSLAKINIPSKVTVLSTRLFYSCPMLSTVTFDEGSQLTTIASYAFAHTQPDSPSSLQHISLPNSLTTIEIYAFGNSNALLDVTFPSSVTTIGAVAFQFATSLETVIFASGNSMTALESAVFDGCHSLTTVKLPDTMSVIGSKAFQGCPLLTEDNFDFTKINEIGEAAFSDTGFVTLVIPANVKKIGSSAFSLCDDLVSVQFTGNYSAGINTSGMFDNCENLTSIIFPAGITEIGNSMFLNCRNLTEITIPDTVTRIGVYAFGGQIGNLTYVNISNDSQLETIDNHAFYLRDRLVAIYLPATIKSIGDYAFTFCDSLTSLTFADGANGVEIGNDAFRRDINLVINNWECITSIGANAFEDCAAFTEITLNDDITYVGANAFARGNTTAKLTINIGLTYVDVYKRGWPNTWNGNATVIYATAEGEDLLTDNDGKWQGFYDADLDKIVVTKYVGTDVNVSFPDVFEYEQNEYGIIWADGVFQNNTKVESVSVVLDVLPFKFFYGCTALKQVTLCGFSELDVTYVSIGDSAFEGCNNLTTISLRSDVVVVSIGNNAFNNTGNLIDVGIDFTNVTNIGDYAFYGNTSWTQDIYLSSALTNIGAYAFYNCKALSIHLGDVLNSLTGIPQAAFSTAKIIVGDDGVLTIPNTVVFIGKQAFYMCRYGNVSALVINANPELYIGDSAFDAFSFWSGTDGSQKLNYILIKGTPNYIGSQFAANNWYGTSSVNTRTPIFFEDMEFNQVDGEQITDSPEGWSEGWYYQGIKDEEPTYRPVYGKGTWHYEDGDDDFDGVPTPNEDDNE